VTKIALCASKASLKDLLKDSSNDNDLKTLQKIFETFKRHFERFHKILFKRPYKRLLES